MYAIKFEDGSCHSDYGFGWTLSKSEVKQYETIEDAQKDLDGMMGGAVVSLEEAYSSLRKLNGDLKTVSLGVGDSSTYVVTMDNQKLNQIAEECGLVVDSNNRQVTAAEIEFFGEQIVKDIMMTILEQKPEEGSTIVYKNLVKLISEKFGVKL